MSITIANRYRPFSRTAGVKCLVPETDIVLSVYPTKIVCGTLEIELPTKGLVNDFLVVQDLEKRRVLVSGKSESGFFRFEIKREGVGVWLRLKKGAFEFTPQQIGESNFTETKSARLSCGVTKKQEVESVFKRLNICEFMPMLYALSQSLPSVSDQGEGGPFDLLKSINDKRDVASTFSNLMKSSFGGLFVPKLVDERYQGILTSKGEGLPLAVIKKAAHFIERCLIYFEDGKLHLLSQLPPEMHAGRITGLEVVSGLVCDLEWSKKKVRRLVLHTQDEMALTMNGVNSCRIRTAAKGRGEEISLTRPFGLMENKTYYLDHFQ